MKSVCFFLFLKKIQAHVKCVQMKSEYTITENLKEKNRLCASNKADTVNMLLAGA